MHLTIHTQNYATHLVHANNVYLFFYFIHNNHNIVSIFSVGKYTFSIPYVPNKFSNETSFKKFYHPLRTYLITSLYPSK